MSDASAKIRVLVAEDSPVQRELLTYLLEEGGFVVIGAATNGREAVDLAARLQPDIVLMDLHMPQMDGLAAIREIMASAPVPIVLASATAEPDDANLSFEALRSGALAFIVKPSSPRHPDFGAQSQLLLNTLRLMSEVKVVRRWPVRAAAAVRSPADVRSRPRKIRILAIGGSTGAPGILADILAALPRDLPASVVVVQHMAPGFVGGLATWLRQKTPLRVEIAADHMEAAPGTVYLAPDGRQSGVDPYGRFTVKEAAAESGFCPSVSHLFESVAKSFGPEALGVLLTGMGRDGASGLLAIRRAGGVTVAQDEASCVVYGMPRVAIELGGAEHVLDPDGIIQLIRRTAYPVKESHHESSTR